MFSERVALRFRLEQMSQQEERLKQLFIDERNEIYSRLRELDAEENNDSSIREQVEESIATPSYETEASLPSTPTPPSPTSVKPSSSKSKRGRKPTRTPEKEAAITILKQNPDGMKGVDLQKAVEEVTGSDIANMTTFMKSVENLDPNVKKPIRGMYTYEGPIEVAQDESEEDFPLGQLSDSDSE